MIEEGSFLDNLWTGMIQFLLTVVFQFIFSTIFGLPFSTFK